MSKLRIPSRYTLLGQTIQVAMDKSLMATHDARGMYSPIPYIVMLHPQDVAVGHFQQSVEQTFCHELTHSILHMMGEQKLYDNEKFVDLFGHLLHQALTTMEYK